MRTRISSSEHLHLTGHLVFAQAAITRMARQGSGYLLFVGSISAEIDVLCEGVYAATWAGMRAFVEPLRGEMADCDIKVSVIRTGPVDTEMERNSEARNRAAIAEKRTLPATDAAEQIPSILTCPLGYDIVNARIASSLKSV